MITQCIHYVCTISELRVEDNQMNTEDALLSIKYSLALHHPLRWHSGGIFEVDVLREKKQKN